MRRMFIQQIGEEELLIVDRIHETVKAHWEQPLLSEPLSAIGEKYFEVYCRKGTNARDKAINPDITTLAKEIVAQIEKECLSKGIEVHRVCPTQEKLVAEIVPVLTDGVDSKIRNKLFETIKRMVVTQLEEEALAEKHSKIAGAHFELFCRNGKDAFLHAAKREVDLLAVEITSRIQDKDLAGEGGAAGLLPVSRWLGDKATEEVRSVIEENLLALIWARLEVVKKMVITQLEEHSLAAECSKIASDHFQVFCKNGKDAFLEAIREKTRSLGVEVFSGIAEKYLKEEDRGGNFLPISSVGGAEAAGLVRGIVEENLLDLAMREAEKAGVTFSYHAQKKTFAPSPTQIAKEEISSRKRWCTLL